MPQMSPLLWAWLFLLFSLMLLASFIKLYFMIHNKTISLKETMDKTEISLHENKEINWMW